MTPIERLIADIDKILPEDRIEIVPEGVAFISSHDSKKRRLVLGNEFERLANTYAAASTEAKSGLISMIVKAYVQPSDSDVPFEFEVAGENIYPQLWSVSRINAFQANLSPAVRLLWCGIHGESEDEVENDIGVVVLYEVCAMDKNGCVSATPILSTHVSQWRQNFVHVLRRAVLNLRERTKGNTQKFQKHESGAIQFCWQDTYDSARVLIFPSLPFNALKNESRGAVLAAFPEYGNALATTARNAIGCCYLGDRAFAITPKEKILSQNVYRLSKVKVSSFCKKLEHHPLRQKAGEGLIWRWSKYTPTLSSGEYCIPRNEEQVDSILGAIECGDPLPIFGEIVDAQTTKRKIELAVEFKNRGNVAFGQASIKSFKEALRLYENGIRLLDENYQDGIAGTGLFFSDPTESYHAKTLLAALQANAAAALVKLAQEDKQKELAAVALRHAMRAVQILPEYAKGHHRCAAAFHLLGEFTAAVESEKVAIGIAEKIRLDKQNAIEAITKARNAVTEKKQAKAKAKADAFQNKFREEQGTLHEKQSEMLPPGAGPTLINIDDSNDLTSLGLMAPSISTTDYSLFSSASSPSRSSTTATRLSPEIF